MGFVPNSLNPENSLDKKFFTSKKKIYPDGSWTAVHSLGALFPDKEYNARVDKIQNGLIGILQVPCNIPGLEDFYEPFEIDISDFTVIGDCSSSDHSDDLPKEKKKRNDNIDIEHSIRRAKSKIFDIAMCNDWSYFFTGTFATNDLQTDPKKCLAKMRKWLNNAVERKGLKYILVAEYTPINHLIHFHGLFNNAGFTYDFNDMYSCEQFKKPVKLKTLKNKHINPDTCKKVYNIREWQKSFGWCTAIELYGNKVAIARYITKYLTKDCVKIFGKYYWSSKNIVRSPDIELFNVSDDYFWNHLPDDTFYIPFCELPLKYDCSFRTRGETIQTKEN